MGRLNAANDLMVQAKDYPLTTRPTTGPDGGGHSGGLLFTIHYIKTLSFKLRQMVSVSSHGSLGLLLLSAQGRLVYFSLARLSNVGA